jgi:hypothetical protein
MMISLSVNGNILADFWDVAIQVIDRLSMDVTVHMKMKHVREILSS